MENQNKEHKHYPIEEVKNALILRQERKNDHIRPLEAVNFLSDPENGDKLIFTDDDGRTRSLTPTLTGWKQVCDNLKYGDETSVPWHFFLNGMTSEQRKSIFDRLSKDRTENNLIRCDADTLYGVVSPKYKPIDHDTIIPVLEGASTPIVSVSGSYVGYDHGKFRFIRESDSNNVLASTGAHGGFRTLNNKHVPLIEFNNSENGLGSWQIRVGVYTFICRNGLIVGVKLFDKKIVHLGTQKVQVPDIDRLWDIAEGYVENLYAAESKRITQEKKIEILLTANKNGMTQEMLDRVVVVANREYEGANTVGGVVHAFTRAAQYYRGDDIAKRTQMEVYAGGLLLAA